MTTGDRNWTNRVPHISKASFDDEATAFLQRYCPEALLKPMAVPIDEIAKKKLGLTVLEKHLTEDLSIFGEMCFSKGLVEIYDPEQDEYREILVEAGTMILDPDTLFVRNIGCKRNTEAHECVHWTKHWDYYFHTASKGGSNTRACKCPVQEKNYAYSHKWSDEDWMEWQANGIAPRILMPRQTAIAVFEGLCEACKTHPFVSKGYIPRNPWIVEQFAGFYQVSKQSAQIRLHELGCLKN